MQVGILYFPGTNCERELYKVLKEVYGFSVDFLWYQDFFSPKYDIYFLPGGFSYGDYLRSGALAASSKALFSLKEAIKKGAYVLGICNGFQILTEAHILPGALIRNASLIHRCLWVPLEGEGDWSFPDGFMLPVSHSEGNYYIEEEERKKLEDEGRIALIYKKNPNGSVGDIAGVWDKKKRVLGIMPHPERAVFPSIGGEIPFTPWGKVFFDAFFSRIK